MSEVSNNNKIYHFNSCSIWVNPKKVKKPKDTTKERKSRKENKDDKPQTENK
jgi:hypothetical protein